MEYAAAMAATSSSGFRGLRVRRGCDALGGCRMWRARLYTFGARSSGAGRVRVRVRARVRREFLTNSVTVFVTSRRYR